MHLICFVVMNEHDNTAHFTCLMAEISTLEKNGRQTELAVNIPQPDNRSRSAPERAEKTQRKNWNASSVNIKTARGDKMHLHAPGMYTY